MPELKENKSIFICKRYKELLDDGTYDYSYDWLGALIVIATNENEAMNLIKDFSEYDYEKICDLGSIDIVEDINVIGESQVIYNDMVR